MKLTKEMLTEMVKEQLTEFGPLFNILATAKQEMNKDIKEMTDELGEQATTAVVSALAEMWSRGFKYRNRKI